jgi:hypothetical protein
MASAPLVRPNALGYMQIVVNAAGESFTFICAAATLRRSVHRA